MTERIPIYNPEEVYNKKIIGRKILYLEHNIWIDLCAMNTIESKRIYQIILALKERDKIIIPLSYSLISELLSQPHDADRKRRITLADQLSNGMTFRAYRSILSAELVNAFTESPLAPHIACRPFVFSYIPDHQGDYYCSPANETQAALQEAHNFALLYKENSYYHSLSFLVDSGVADKVRKNHISSQAYYLQEISASASVPVTDDLIGRLKFDSLINQERRLVFESLVRKILRELVMSGTINPGSMFNRKFTEYQSDLARFFKLVPTLDAACRIYAVHSADIGRRPKRQDFYDVEHARIAHYCDIYATNDGNLYQMLNGNFKATKRFGCQVVRGIPSLLKLLCEMYELD